MADRSPRRVGPKLRRKDLEIFLGQQNKSSEKKTTVASNFGSSLVPITEEKFEIARNLKDEAVEDMTQPLGGTTEGLPLELFDDAATYEECSPEEWILRCKEWELARIRWKNGASLDGSPPPEFDGHVLHYVDKEWKMTSCFVKGYNPKLRRYLVQLVSNGQEKAVRRLALRFISEDKTRFRERVTSCKERRMHVELQQQFIAYIESADDSLVAPMYKDTKDRFSKHALFCAGLKDPRPFTASIRQLLVDIEQNYLISMKFSRAKQQLIKKNGTFEAYIDEETMNSTPFAKLLIPFLPKSPPDYGLVTRLVVGQMPLARKAHAIAQMPLIAEPRYWKAAEMVVTRFLGVSSLRFLVSREDSPEYQAEIQSGNVQVPLGARNVTGGLKARLLAQNKKAIDEKKNTAPVGGIAAGIAAKAGASAWTPSAFIKLQTEHAHDVTAALERVWREYAISETAETLTPEYTATTSSSDHYKSTLHRALRRTDLIMSQQLRHFVLSCIEDWVHFFESFVPLSHLNPAGAIASSAAPNVPGIVDFQPGVSLAHQDPINNNFSSEADKCDPDAIIKPGKPSQHPPQPLLVLRIHVSHDGSHVVLDPPPEHLIKNISSLTDIIASCASRLKNVEPEVVPFCNIPEVPLFAIPTSYSPLADARDRVSKAIQVCLEGPRALLQAYKKFENLLGSEFENAFEWSTESIDACRARLLLIRQYQTDIFYVSSSLVLFPMIEVVCSEIKESLIERCDLLLKLASDALKTRVETDTQNMGDGWREVMATVKRTPTNEEELRDLKEYLKQINTYTSPLIAQTKHIHAMIAMMNDFNLAVDLQTMAAAFQAFGDPQQVKIAVDETRNSLEYTSEGMAKKLEEERDEFFRELQRDAADLKFIQEGFASFENARAAYSRVHMLTEHLAEGTVKVKEFKKRESLFNQEPSDFHQLEVIKREFEPYQKLWTIANEFTDAHEQWTQNNLWSISAMDAENKLNQWTSDVRTMLRSFEAQPIPKRVCEELKVAIDSFKVNLRLMHALCTRAMTADHWVELFNALSVHDFDKSTIDFQSEGNGENTISLNLMIQHGVRDFIELCEDINNKATKELHLKTMLADMKMQWKAATIDAVPYKNTGTYILGGSDVIQALLDDHIVKTLTIRSSPFVVRIDAQAREWQNKLDAVQKLLETWLAVQREWMYLQPIFASEDIQRQLGELYRDFITVDTIWRQSMAQVAEVNTMLDVAEFDNLQLHFDKARSLLGVIQKEIKAYLESKRLKFPRLFFLSDDELLTILSQTKDPVQVQPHMSKCFEGVEAVIFNKDNTIIEGMRSSTNEMVMLFDRVNVVEGDKNGNVEKWLEEFEISMGSCLRNITANAIESYATSKRTKWVKEYPQQVVLAVDCIFWTQEVTEALGKQNGLSEYSKKLQHQLLEVVDMVRGDFSDNLIQTLGALITIDVHARDVVDALAQAGVKSDDEFDWMAQLRYYWCPAGSIFERGTERPTKRHELQVRIVNSELLYGFEYLGNSDRLVITPLTDRCYRTLMGAFHLYYGGAPEGPAGTGKTETTKDLAKALAVKCVVFNCTDSLDHLAMAKFFKGLASTGCWCCFDEFNRIDVEVLSVIAEQVLTIQNAIRSHAVFFTFEETELKLVPTCAVNITMNPGYAGRAELPDNLKALFRPCAMMVPDYSLIAEISLYSSGFSEAKILSRKCVASLRLSSEQLSSQDHYDFGMRALKAILRAAGLLKRKYGNQLAEPILALRALNDVNIPKFTKNDIELFKGITSDLFPGAEVPPTDYTSLLAALRWACAERNLQPTEIFLKKCIQLWETILVRHGLMLVGRTISGKSMVLQCLEAALSKVAEEEGTSSPYLAVHSYNINPKAVGPGMLYGIRDENTQEFSMGVLANAVRDAADTFKRGDGRRKWVILDGPVDAVWIEDMNTVLDDNKKLCLASSEVIFLSSVTTMMFEVEDLLVASPATVSRCGMVFLEPSQLGWEPMLLSWVEKWSPVLKEPTEKVNRMMLALCPPMLEIAQRVKNPVPVSVNWLVLSALRFLTSQLFEYLPEFRAISDKELEEFPDSEETSHQKEIRKKRLENIGGKEREARLEFIVIFSLIWTVGACTDESGRLEFDKFLKRYLVASNEEMSLVQTEFSLIDLPLCFASACAGPDQPPKSVGQIALEKPDVWTYYDVYLNEARNKWAPWTEQISTAEIAPGTEVQNIIVPTGDSVKCDFFLKTLIKAGVNVTLSGSTGTGKTIAINSVLNSLSSGKFMSISFAFSAKTTCNQTQDMIKAKLGPRGKGCLAPAVGKKALVFIDDVNMPQKEKYGAQPPVELLRQSIELKGWYNNENVCEWTKLADVQYLNAMAPPGGGKTDVTMRFMRQANLIFLTPFGDDTLNRIFNRILNFHLTPFPQTVSSQTSNIVKSTIEIFKKVCDELRPTPAKSHYSFNLRDMARVIQGICLCKESSLPDMDSLLKCWVHESFRVFSDRLADSNDILWFKNLMNTTLQDSFRRKLDTILPSDGSPLLFGDFMDSSTEIYQQLPDIEKVKVVLETALLEHNVASPRNQLTLVFFAAAIEHVTRIIRVLRQPLGNAMLIGVGGSGRKSLARLSAHIAIYDVLTVEVHKKYGINEWREDLSKLTQTAGTMSKNSMFLLSDTQLKDEGMVEDISSFLNTGEIANLYSQDDKMSILEACTKPASKNGFNGPQEVMEWFIGRVRSVFHVVLCFSPIGDAFRNRLRMFPSLVNCCTLDWFLPWSKDALHSVAMHYMQSELDVEPDFQLSVCNVCVEMQSTAEVLTVKLREDAKRHNYITPSSYLELLESFRSVLRERRQKLETNRSRYSIGIETLDATELQVDEMRKQIEIMKPELKAKEAEVAIEVESIAQKEAVVSVQAAEIAKEEFICAEQMRQAEEAERECQGRLDQAMPAQQAAQKALEELDKSSIIFIKSYKKPQDVVKVTMMYVCLLLSSKPSGRNPSPDDWWKQACKEMNFPQALLDRLKSKDLRIPAENKVKIQECLADTPTFSQALVAKASAPVYALLNFLRNFCVYDDICEEIDPLKLKVAESKAQVAVATEKLNKAKAELAEVNANLEGLRSNLAKNKAVLQDLKTKYDDCLRKSQCAVELLEGLGGEKASWRKAAEKLEKTLKTVVADSLLSAGVIAYLGVFPANYRTQATQEWQTVISKTNLIDNSIKLTSDFSLEEFIGDPVEIQDWQINGLPADRMSVENAIIVKKSRKWPLMIDPQMQANLWLKQQYKGSEIIEENKSQGKKRQELTKEQKMIQSGAIRVIRLTTKDLQRELETCIKFGIPVLLENVDEKLDPLLQPILQKAVFKMSGVLMIKIGESSIDYNPDFKIFLTTHLPNPHFPPEICVQVALLNFVVTPEGLREQLLAHLVNIEDHQTELARAQAISEAAEFNKTLKKLEDTILEMISDRTVDILDNQPLVDTLNTSKKTQISIESKLQELEASKTKSNEVRAAYSPVAHKASHLFFVICDLGFVDHMYQFSLTWYRSVYDRSIRSTGQVVGEANSRNRSNVRRDAKQFAKRITDLTSNFQRLLFQNVCLALFEKDKLLFAFLLATKVMMVDGTIDPAQFRLLLLAGGSTLYDEAVPEEISGWLDKLYWDRFLELEKLGGVFTNICQSLRDPVTGGQWKKLFDVADPLGPVEVRMLTASKLATSSHLDGKPHSAKDIENLQNTVAHENIQNGLPPWPLGLREKTTDLEKCLLMNALRPDRVVGAIQGLIATVLGMEFLKPPSLNLDECYQASAPAPDAVAAKPLLFVLSPGADPMVDLQNLAKSKDIVINPISLGKGQDKRAITAIKRAREQGEWAVLQNCHLARSFLPLLEYEIDQINNLPREEVHVNFRLWLTAMPAPYFPMAVIQNAVKMTNEPPRGLQANLSRSYKSINGDFLEHQSPTQWRKLFYGLCFFHALILERRRFGALGWNIPYEFSEPDRSICAMQLRGFLDDYANKSSLPWDALNYMAAEANYGGRVTDYWDRRLIVSLLRTFYNPNILKDGYSLTTLGANTPYVCPSATYDREETLEFIQQIPLSVPPEVFGLHSNANLTAAINDALAILRTAQTVQPKGGNSSSSSSKKDEAGKEIKKEIPVKPEDLYRTVAAEILAKLPQEFDTEAVSRKYVISYSESMNTVLVQELMRFNRIIIVVRRTLIELQLALVGKALMTPDLEAVAKSLVDNAVPEAWSAKAYPSLKPLSSWFADFLRRLKFMKDWIDNGAPTTFWISGFYFTQSFLSGVLQNYARKMRVPIDELEFSFQILPRSNTWQSISDKPEVGCYVYGLFMDGARWDDELKQVNEALPKKLFDEMPVVWLRPIESIRFQQKEILKAAIKSSKKPEDVGLTTEIIGDLERLALFMPDHFYDCPVYKTSRRAGTLSTTGHSTNYVLPVKLPISTPASSGSVDMNTIVKDSAYWTRRSVALLTQLDS